MSRIILMLLLSCFFLMSAVSRARTTTLVNKEKTVIIPFSKVHKFQFGSTPQSNKTILLKIKSRMDTKGLGGSLHFLKIIVNGHVLEPNKGRSVCRLLNKPLIAPVTPKLNFKWCDGSKWNVLYAPDFKAAYTQKYYVGDPYLYVFDITDLANPVAENRIEILNCATSKFVARVGVKHKKGKKLDMVIGSLIIEEKSGASPTMKEVAGKVVVINRGEPAAGPASYRGKLLSGGGFVLNIGNNTYRFLSRFSYPDAGFNYLNADKQIIGQKGWKVSVKDNKVIAKGPYYTIVRTVKFTSRRVEISDAITNHNKKSSFGLAVRNEMILGTLKDSPIRLAGCPDPARSEYYSPLNPSVHIVTPDGGIGFIAEDDVYRCQARLYIRSDNKMGQPVAGIRTDMLRLAPGETYTLKWAVYPVAGRDYYDFINLARVDWSANYTAVGPWRWGGHSIRNMSVKKLRSLIKQQDIRYYIGGDWVESKWHPANNKKGIQRIAFGSDVFSEYWAYRRKASLKTIDKLRKASPRIKTFWYFDVMRESANDTLTRFKDSLFIDKNGRPVVTVWPNTKNPTYQMVPTLKNNFGKAALETARRYLDEAGLDGIYWDETGGIQFNRMLISYSNYDGHSCLLDPKTWRMKRQVGIVLLSAAPFQNAVIKMIKKRGKMLLTNGSPVSLQARKNIQCMIEVQHNSYYAFEGNLNTPLGYMSWSSSWDDFLRVFGMATLPADCLQTVLPHDISPFLFPFTTIEIHPGYMLAKERIVATHSGNYGWVGTRSLAQVRHFNKVGRLTNLDFMTTINSEARTAVTLNAKEAIVLERVPLCFEPGNGSKAEVEEISYDTKAISLYLNAPHGGELKIDSGKFPLQEAKSINVYLDNKLHSIEVVNKKLNISVPAGFSGFINVGERKSNLRKPKKKIELSINGVFSDVTNGLPAGWVQNKGSWARPYGKITSSEGVLNINSISKVTEVYFKKNFTAVDGDQVTFSLESKGKGSLTFGYYVSDKNNKWICSNIKQVKLTGKFQRFTNIFTVKGKKGRKAGTIRVVVGTPWDSSASLKNIKVTMN